VNEEPKKKRSPQGKSKPVQRSLKVLAENGWQVAIVERYIKFGNMPFGKRIDVWGFGDLLVCRPPMADLPGAVALVQCCRDADIAAHRDKILAIPEFYNWKRSNGRVFLQGWAKKGPRGEKKRWTMREIEL
jgi:hypothetical protein